MGLVKGGLNGVVMQTTPRESVDDIRASLRRGGLPKPIPPRDPDRPLTCWVEIERPHLGDFTDSDAWQFTGGDLVAFTFRQDAVKVNATYRRIAIAEALESFYAHEGHRPNRAQKKEIKEQVTDDLFRRALPNTIVADVAWNWRTGRVLVCTASASVAERVRLLFNETFGDDSRPETRLRRHELHHWVTRGEGPERLPAGFDRAYPNAQGTKARRTDDGWENPFAGAQRDIGLDFFTWLWLVGQGEADGAAHGGVEDRVVLERPGSRMVLEGDQIDWSQVNYQLTHEGRLVEARLRIDDIAAESSAAVTLGLTPLDDLKLAKVSLPRALGKTTSEQVDERFLMHKQLFDNLDALFNEFLRFRCDRGRWAEALESLS